MLSSIPEEELGEMLKQAVYQQLFLGQDIIMGRMPKDSMKIKNVGVLLTNFIDELKKNLKFLDPDDLNKFLGKFETKFGLELSDVKVKVEQNFLGMGELDGQELVIFYMVLTKMLENIREQAYLIHGWNELVNIYQKSGRHFNDNIHRQLNNMAAIGNPQISLIYNLCFIKLLADVFDNKKMSINTKRQITRKINILIGQLEKEGVDKANIKQDPFKIY